MKKKVVLILSGGVDSTTLLYELKAKGYEVYAVSFNYGQKHSKELKSAKKTCKKLGVNHKIVDITSIKSLVQSALTTQGMEVPEGNYQDKSMKLTVVPNRNMILLSLAMAYAINIGAKDLFYGAHAGDHAIYPDCRPRFVKAMQKVAKLCDYKKINLYAPYLNIDKGEIVKKGKKLGVDYSLTWTCYKGLEKACGKCGSCTERIEAFKKAKMKDPMVYEK